MSGRDFAREIPVEFPESQTQHDVLATLWARTRVDDLMGQDFNGLQQGNMKPELKETITQLGLEYRLMTQFTSFVAVEEMVVTDGGQPRRIDVPVEVPAGVSREGVFGQEEGRQFGFSAGRNVKSLYLASANSPSATQTVTVTSAAPAIDMTSSSVTTVIDQSVINPGSVPAPASEPRKENSKRNSRPSGTLGGGAGGSGSGTGTGSGIGTGPGRGGNVGGGSFKVDGVASAKPDAKEEERRQLSTRLHPSLLAVIDRLKNKEAKPAAEEAKFIRDGKAELQIWLTDKSEVTLAKLKELGFELVLDPKTAKLVIGRLPIENLAALAELKSVRYVAPQLSTN